MSSNTQRAPGAPDTAKNPFLVALGERVKSLRSRRGMTRRATAQAAGVSERHLANLAYGIRNASLLVPIALVLGLTAVVMGVLGVLKQLLLADLADRLDTTLGSQIVGHLFKLPLRFFDRRTVGDLASRL
ncbi:MAG: ABC transporter transmembrane domain-containing protein, partial [Burkholderiaceae bacterium]